MELTGYVDKLREQLAVAAAAGGEETLAQARRLAAALESAARLTLLDALSAAAAEITNELAPGSVEVRLRGGDPEFVVTMASPETAEELVDGPSPMVAPAGAVPAGDAVMARINLRLPEPLKYRVDQSAERDGLSINAWLVRAITAAVDGPAGPPAGPRTSRSGQRYTGWAR